MESRHRAFLLLLLIGCVLVISCVPCAAIHEDEQGLRDWILRFVGHVEHAAFIPGRKVENVFVASSQGAVASLSFGQENPGKLLWRQLFSDPPVCLAAGRPGVVVASANGTVHLLSAASGTLKSTFKLVLPSGATVASCLVDGAALRFAALGSSSAYLYAPHAASEGARVAHVSEVPVGDGVRAAHLCRQHMWLQRVDSADRVPLAAPYAADVRGVAGHRLAAAETGEAVVTSRTAVRVAGFGETSAACALCDAAPLVDAGGAFVGPVTASLARDGVWALGFPGGRAVRVGGNGSAAPAVLLAVRDGPSGTRVLLRAPTGHLVAVTDAAGGGVLWERAEGLAALAATAIVPSPWEADHFSFAKVAVGVSRYGLVYAIPVTRTGGGVRVVADLSESLRRAAGGAVEKWSVDAVVPGARAVTVWARAAARRVALLVHLASGEVEAPVVHEDALLVAATFGLTRAHTVAGRLPHDPLYVFTVNRSAGLLQGFLATAASGRAAPLWRVQLPSPIVAYASGEDKLRTTVVNQLRVFPNRSGKEPTEEVRRKYATRNVLVVAHYEPSEEELTTLVVTAVDAVTGSVLATARHRSVEGDVHLVVVEHAVLYYFLDAVKMRHCVGVWEMFEEESGHVVRKDAGATLPQVIASFFLRNKRTFSSRASRPPFVTVAVLGIHGSSLAQLSVTTSFGGIARKSVIFAFSSGRVATIELNRLLAGGQMPIDDKGNQLTHVMVPSTSLASHKYRVALPRLIATEPTDLESSCHVLVSGLDIFYVRTSSGKAFDLLNSDFNKNLLIMLTAGFGVLSLIVRYFVMRKGLNMMWQ